MYFCSINRNLKTQVYIVPTPIGNLKDISLRALEVLREVDVILAEDTRTSGKLLKHYEIATPMRSYHMHNEHKLTEKIGKEIATGIVFALISDAGTPGISDPGHLLIRACIEHEVAFEILPGATAFVPALLYSGLPNHRFVYEGFLPVKKGRQTRLEALKDETRTMIFYESPHKLVKTLTQFAEYFGADRETSVSRELTKLYEETQRGSLQDLIEYFTQKTPKGEFVIVVNGKK